MDAKYGQQIRAMRKAKGLTQIEFANKVRIAVNSLRRYEADERQPTMEVIEAMAAALDMSTQEFLWGSPAGVQSYFWTADLDEKLKQVGCCIGAIEAEGYLWINYPDGTLEVTEEELKELHDSTNSFIKFKLDELKKKHPGDFKPLKDKTK